MSSNILPVKKENFLAEVEVMDLSAIRDKTFAIAVSTGPVDGIKYLCSTLHGPYSFVEMLQEVGDMWIEHQHHAKVIIMEKKASTPIQMLDANTVDYVECHYVDLITEEMIGGAFGGKTYTCRAGLVCDEEVSTKEVDALGLPAPRPKK